LYKFQFKYIIYLWANDITTVPDISRTLWVVNNLWYIGNTKNRVSYFSLKIWRLPKTINRNNIYCKMIQSDQLGEIRVRYVFKKFYLPTRTTREYNIITITIFGWDDVRMLHSCNCESDDDNQACEFKAIKNHEICKHLWAEIYT